ncbi:ATP-binding protein [Kamptonema formosum]|uniref:ATP-binding protein n=1 Tax=Kamptonema formosum TaxID=331992 RepID=UPI000347079F|nr:AAA family ATPase [Oscillatoria sp. PCC 10802]
MNITPRPPTPNPTEFQRLIRDKSAKFVGREFVLAEIAGFLHRHARGYFTLVGAPGTGKSAILAKFVASNPGTIYYSAEVGGKNDAGEFLATICTQLISQGEALPARTAEPQSLSAPTLRPYSLLLQEISDRLAPEDRLVIAIDGLDRIDPNSQSPDSNLFYLPRYLPERVYFLLARRPFLREKSGLLIESPSQLLDLGNYPEQNQADVRAYIEGYLTHPSDPSEGTGEENSPLAPALLRGALKSWLTDHYISEADFTQQLAAKSENNFAYLSYILPAIAEGLYPEPLQFDRLPAGLEAYYQEHWQKMGGENLSSLELGVLRALAQQEQPVPVGLVAEMIDEDEYDVGEVLENWLEFLVERRAGGEVCYSLYHSSFRDWLRGRIYSSFK